MTRSAAPRRLSTGISHPTCVALCPPLPASLTPGDSISINGNPGSPTAQARVKRSPFLFLYLLCLATCPTKYDQHLSAPPAAPVSPERLRWSLTSPPVLAKQRCVCCAQNPPGPVLVKPGTWMFTAASLTTARVEMTQMSIVGRTGEQHASSPHRGVLFSPGRE